MPNTAVAKIGTAIISNL